MVELKLGGPDRCDDGGFLAVSRDGKLVVAGTHRDQNLAPGILEVVAVPSIAPVADVAPTIEAAPNPASAGPVEFLVHVRNNGPGRERRRAEVRGHASDWRGADRPGRVQLTAVVRHDLHPWLDPGWRGGGRVGHDDGHRIRGRPVRHGDRTSSSNDLDTGNDAATAEVVINPT